MSKVSYNSYGLIHGDMNAETGVLLWLISPSKSIYKGKGYNNVIGCTTCSLSQHLMQ